MNLYRKLLICFIFTILANGILAAKKIRAENGIYNLLPEDVKELLKDSLNEYVIPNLAMFDNEWKSYENISIPMFVLADFNGDKKNDYAFILQSKKLNNTILCAFVSNPKSYSINRLGTYDLSNGYIDVYIGLEKKGYWKNPSGKLYIKNNGISFVWSSASLMYSYYWEKDRFIKFLYD